MATIIKNARAVLPDGLRSVDIMMDGGIITGIESDIAPSQNDTVVNASGKLVIPGVIDSHVHYHMKTATGRNADDFSSGSSCAAVSGTTTIVDFASPIESMTLTEALNDRMGEADGSCFVDYTFHMELTGDFFMDLSQMKGLRDSGIKALKIYTTYGSSEFPPERLNEFFEAARENGMITLVHAEENSIVTSIKEDFIKHGKTGASYHAQSRPVIAEVTAINRIIKLAKAANAPIIIAHISSGDGGMAVAAAKESGQAVYGETCPHYLLLTDELYAKDDPQRYIMTPPLRTKHDNDTLISLVKSGAIDKISTDHCPFTLEDKLKKEGCFEAIPGIGGSETLLPTMFSELYSKGRLTIEELSARMSSTPAKLYGLYPKKGCIAVGSDADVVIVDPDAEYEISYKLYPSKAGYSVFEGMKAEGKPVATYLRGELIAKDGKMVATTPSGRFVKAL